MRKKSGKIIGGILLGAVFIILIGIYCREYDMGNIRRIFGKDSEETLKEIRGPAPEKKGIIPYEMREM